MTATEPTIEERSDELDRLESEVARLIRRARRVVAHRAQLVHPELHGASYLMLNWVAQHGPVRAGAIAEEFCVDKGAASRMVQSLADLGLVERQSDPADRRASLVSATTDALERLGRVHADRRRYLNGKMSDWPTAELGAFGDLLARYNETVESLPDAYHDRAAG